MKRSVHQNIGAIALALALILKSSESANANDPPDNELTVAAVAVAIDGWRMYKAKEFAGGFMGGHYTDPRPDREGKEFWSDGNVAKVDRGSDGHFETVFLIVGEEIVYVGTIGTRGRFIDVARKFESFLASTVDESLEKAAR